MHAVVVAFSFFSFPESVHFLKIHFPLELGLRKSVKLCLVLTVSAGKQTIRNHLLPPQRITIFVIIDTMQAIWHDLPPVYPTGFPNCLDCVSWSKEGRKKWMQSVILMDWTAHEWENQQADGSKPQAARRLWHSVRYLSFYLLIDWFVEGL